MFFADISDFPFAGIAAILATLGGVASAVVALRKAKVEGSTACHDLLNECRKESERYAATLHKLRLEHPDLIPPDDPDKSAGRASLWMLASVGLFALAVFFVLTAVGWGDPGPPGPPGPIGPTGPHGLDGTQGPPGTTATTVVVVPGTGTNTGTGGSNGTGATGAAGAAGGTGTAGSAGTAGTAGEAGAAGEAGEAGAAGSTGAVGPPGPPGPAGAAGATGAQGPRGAPGPVQSAPVCPGGFSLQEITLKEKGQTLLVAICVAG